MADLLEAGQQWLAEQLQEHASRSVNFRRGAEEVAVQATIGRTLLKLEDGYGGVQMQWTDRDFLIPAADVVLGGSSVIPHRGDRITDTVGPVTSVFEVSNTTSRSSRAMSCARRASFGFAIRRAVTSRGTAFLRCAVL